mmetsp:Transcript_19067/g.48939  ORF Transcript_19067/g.48939 Transcript_19067/m.48939 type:complete len:654 (-) Transcript_19067:108-2069(-)|eukprot:jgi/Tetstr1/449358/TSEL_003870.t2
MVVLRSGSGSATPVRQAPGRADAARAQASTLPVRRCSQLASQTARRARSLCSVPPRVAGFRVSLRPVSAARPRQAVIRAASSNACLEVKISIQKPVPFGQSLKVIGNHPTLGEWNLDAAPAMEWGEGDVWTSSVMLPAGTWEFKCVITAGDMQDWEDGDNRVIEIPNMEVWRPGGMDAGLLEVTCTWGETAATSSMMSIDDELDDAATELKVAKPAASQDGSASTDGPALEEEGGVVLASGEAGDGGAEAAAPSAEPEGVAAGAEAEAAREWIAAWRATQAVAPAQAEAATEAQSMPQEAEAAHAESAPAAAVTGADSREAALEEAAEAAAVSAGAAWAAILGGGLAVPVVAWSEWTLFSSGCGLPPGPSGLLGAAEGVAYLTVTGIALWSVATKASTGKGLPAGPGGLLGAVEGLSFLAIAAGAGVLGYQYSDRGFIPSFLPDAACYGDQPIEPLDLSGASSAMTAAVESVSAAVRSVDLAPLQQAITSTATDVGSAVKSIDLAPMQQAVSSTADSVANTLSSGAKDASDAVRAIDLTPMQEAITSSAAGLAGALSSGAKDASNAVKSIDFAPMQQAASSTASSVAESLSSIAKDASSALKAIDLVPLQQALRSGASSLSTTASSVGSAVSSTATDIGSSVGAALDSQRSNL